MNLILSSAVGSSLVKAILIQLAFEDIHSFQGGNEQAEWLLVNFMLMDLGYLIALKMDRCVVQLCHRTMHKYVDLVDCRNASEMMALVCLSLGRSL